MKNSFAFLNRSARLAGDGRIGLIVILMLLTLVLVWAFYFASFEARRPARIGVHSWLGYETLFIAQELGWLPSDVSLRVGASAIDSLGALQEGQIQAAAVTLDEAMRLSRQGIDIEIVTVLDLSSGGDVLVASEGIESIEDLRGARLAYEQGAVGELFLRLLMRTFHFELDDLELVAVSPTQLEQGWDQLQLDAAVTYEPLASQLEMRGVTRLLDSSDFDPLIVDVLVVRRGEMSDSQILDILRAIYRAHDHFIHSTDDALHRISARERMPPSLLKKAYQGVIMPDQELALRYLSGQGEVQRAMPLISDLLGFSFEPPKGFVATHYLERLP